MLAVIYRWRLVPGREAQFVEGWERVTRALHAACGSYDSRLHHAADGSWVAYARWPDSETRERCEHAEGDGQQMMREAVAEDFEEITLQVVSDLLLEPEPGPSAASG